MPGHPYDEVINRGGWEPQGRVCPVTLTATVAFVNAALAGAVGIACKHDWPSEAHAHFQAQMRFGSPLAQLSLDVVGMLKWKVLELNRIPDDSSAHLHHGPQVFNT